MSLFRRRRARSMLCPACGSPFLWVQVNLSWKRNRCPKITAIHGLVICAACDGRLWYSDFIEISRKK